MFIQQYNALGYIQPGDSIIIEVLYHKGYGNWNIFAKNRDRVTPIGFYCKKFPWSENKYSLFERTIWATYEATRSTQSLLKQNPVIIRTEIPIIDWIKAPGEAWAGLPMESKVLQWKWHLSDFIKHLKVSTQGKITRQSEKILEQGGGMEDAAWLTPDITHLTKVSDNEKTHPMGHWGTQEYHKGIRNAWFTDGSSTTVNNRVKWKAAAYRPEDGKILTDQGVEYSAQHAEVIAALLAARQSLAEKQKHMYLYTDSWCVANGIAVWSGK